MNSLIDPAPLAVLIGGREWVINADFRTSILFEQLLMDKSVPEYQIAPIALSLYYPVPPSELNAAIEQMMLFYRCGEDAQRKTTSDTGSQRRLYDYDQDAAAIYAAFRADYGIDLEAENLHWWKFRALFDGLRPDNTICKIMEYRGADTKHMKGEQRAYYTRMQRLCAIKRPKEEQARADALEDILIAGGDVRKALEKL